MNDTELLDSLERLAKEGCCPGVINDDAGRWAVSDEGTQNVPYEHEAVDICTTFWISAEKWKPTIREAIEYYLAMVEDE